MKVKYKLYISLIFLFGVIILLGGIGSYYLRWLSHDSAAIMKDNNRTLIYMRNIEEIADKILQAHLSNENNVNNITQLTIEFNEAFLLQRKNVTEPGERELTNKLENSFNRFIKTYKSGLNDSSTIVRDQLLTLFNQIKEETSAIYLINEQTMIRKSEKANSTAEKVVLYMGAFGLTSILVGLAFIIGLPLYISKPLTMFSEAIKEVSKGNYKITIPLESKDEYGDLALSFNKMAAKLDEYEHSNISKVIKEQKRLSALINHLDEVIIGLDESKMVIYANEQCLRVLNLKRHELIGKYAPDVASNCQLLNNMIKELMIGFLKGEEINYKPIKIVDGNHEKLYAKNIIDVSQKPTGENRNKLIGHIIILTDITAFEKKDKAKTHFIATLSHELKTPVSAIDMSTKLLRNHKSGGLNDNQEELLTTIEENNERIRKMINEVLDMSKIENGSLDIQLAETDVYSILEDAVAGVSPFLSEKSLEINQTIATNLPNITVDTHKSIWILNNLLTNAIKHAPEDSRIGLRVTKEGNYVEIAVSDKGPGVSKDDQLKIFEKFTRLSKTHYNGTGLGLAISKEFIDAMRGSIGLKSVEGDGATFWVRFPIA